MMSDTYIDAKREALARLAKDLRAWEKDLSYDQLRDIFYSTSDDVACGIVALVLDDRNV
jgi:hypothetical protein